MNEVPLYMAAVLVIINVLLSGGNHFRDVSRIKFQCPPMVGPRRT